MNWMLPQQKAMVSAESMMETPNTQQLSQKQSLASLSAATINLMRCCLDRMTTSEMRKPTMKVMPDISVSGEYLLIQDLCISVVRKGSRLPKQRQRKPTPNTNISSRHRGVQRYAAIQGIRQIVTTIMMQIAVATPSPISMSGMTCQVDKQGISCPLTLSKFSISSLLWCGARLAARASDTTTANSSRQRTQQNQSVHLRQRIGPSLHCTCSWISLSSSSVIKIQIILSELSCQQQKIPLYRERKTVQLDGLFNVLLLQCLMLLFIKYPLFVDSLYIFLIAMLKLQRLTHCFSSALSVPIVDVKAFLTESGNYTQDCKIVAKALETYGCLIIKDPRVNAEQNNKLLDLMERFFDKRSQQFYAGRPVPDIFPEYHFQVGATPEYAEKARQHHEIITKYSKENTAQTPQPPPFDAKWRYFYNIGDVMEDIAQNRVPSDFPEFKETVEGWGKHMLDGCNTVAEMAAVGLGLERNIFSEMMKRGPHKLAPTGSDLNRYKVGTVFAGFHYDFNFLTIHGKARYPGLFAWLRTGEKFSVAVPEGHLLLQAGKQFEWVTGGHINCGYHEVIYTPEVQAKKNEAIKNGRIPWRISSTLFSHIRGDVTLQPLGKFATAESAKKYPAILAKKHAEEQLQAISLKRS